MDELFSKLPNEISQRLQEFINRELITPNQMKRIFSATFGIKKHTYEQEVEFKSKLKHAAYKTITVLNILGQMKLKKGDKTLNDTIKRLGSANGLETANELFCHFILAHTFPSYYKCFELFSNNPDGNIRIDGKDYRVEIKTRTLEAYETLQVIFKKLKQLIPTLSRKDVSIGIYLEELNTLNSDLLDKEFGKVQELFEEAIDDDFLDKEKPHTSFVYKSEAINIQFTLTTKLPLFMTRFQYLLSCL